LPTFLLRLLFFGQFRAKISHLYSDSHNFCVHLLILALLLGVFSLSLSAFCGSMETGFYRVPRIQLKLDAMRGDIQSKGLLWLANRPSIFVGTILTANNVANYSLSLAGVLVFQEIFGEVSPVLTEIFVTIFLAPVLFVYGEMLPKYVCLFAPKRFLRLGSPLLFFLTALLMPLSGLLWLVNRFFARLLGRPSEMTRLSLAKSELVKTFDEGHEVGVLGRTQRQLIDGIIMVSNQSVKSIVIPIHHYPLITSDMNPQAVLSLTRSLRMYEVPIFGRLDALDGLILNRSQLVPVGYVRTIDLETAVYRKEEKLPIRKLVEVIDNYSLLAALNLLQTSNELLGVVVNPQKRCFGLISLGRLQEQFFS